jgi:hypothetical protein
MTEKNIETYLRRKVSSQNGMALKLISVGVAGIPDRLVLLPGGKIFFAELKAPGKKPRALQKYTHRLIENLGFRVFVIDSKEAVDQVLKEMDSYGVYTSQVSGNGYRENI